MGTRRVCSLLCTAICAGMLMVGLGSQSGVAQNKERELLPVADGFILDHSPFDGVPDGVEVNLGNTVFLTSGLGQSQAAIEFDLGHISPNRIQSAVLKLTKAGTAILPGTLSVPVEIRGYRGDGSIQEDDFNAGSLITEVDALATPDHVSVFVDVTEFVRGIHPKPPRIVGFNLSTDVPDVQINYGSLELETAPTLIITLK